MRCFIVLVLSAYMAAEAEASIAVDAALYEAMQQDASAELMDRSAGAQDRGKKCGSHADCDSQWCRDGYSECWPKSDVNGVCDSRETTINFGCKTGLECTSGRCTGEVEEEETDCPAGWIELDDTCGGASDKLCVTVGQPLKFVSWFHLQYECDAIGGYLPEPTDANNVNLELILSSLHSLYVKDDTPLLMYLGATDVTHENDWKWLKSAEDLAGADTNENWTNSRPPSQADNKDCLAQQSSDKLWTNVNCEDDSMPNQIADICFATPATAKPLE